MRVEVDLLQAPSTSCDLDRGRNATSGFAALFIGTEDQTGAFQWSNAISDVVSLRTSDLERLPLPCIELLQMQWYLTKIVSMPGAANDCDYDDDDDYICE